MTAEEFKEFMQDEKNQETFKGIVSALGYKSEEEVKGLIDKKDELLNHYAIQSERVHTLQQLLKAYTMFNKDDEYVVIDGEVKIVDE